MSVEIIYPADTLARFEAFVVPEPNSGCWLWLGALNKHGYGKFSLEGRVLGAHKASWKIHKGRRIRKGLYVCHKCDTRCCVNPDHLFLGTPRANYLDCKRKGRLVIQRGSAASNATLNEQQVAAIMADERPQREIAAEYGVKVSAVQGIKAGRWWVHVTGGRRTSRGRLRGEQNPRSKLTPEKVRDIRADQRSAAVVAREIGMSRLQILRIRQRKFWRHVD